LPTQTVSAKGTVSKRKKVLKIYCGVEQLVARRAHNPEVVSSSLAPATKTSVFTGVFSFVGNLFEIKRWLKQNGLE
jgi:hypothetical protein